MAHRRLRLRCCALLATLCSALLQPSTAHQAVLGDLTAPQLFATSIDTMKESRDTETRPLTDAQIAADVNASAALNTTYITVDTHWDYPDYMQHWVRAVRATGRHVWFRIHPNQWGNNNGSTGIMTPAAYEQAEQSFLSANAALFQSGDILDPCPEPENSRYWIATYGNGWTTGAPNTATREYNAFIRDTTEIADEVLHQAGVYGVITTVRSTNSFFAGHPGALEAATVARMGRVTVDSYPEGTTTDPAMAAQARVTELNAIQAAWHVPIVIGEIGYSDKVPVDDLTQQSVLAAELNALATLPYLTGINYWVGAGTDNSGGYTHLFSGGTGSWSWRPAAATLAGFYARYGVQSPSATTTPSPTVTATPSRTPTNTPSPSATATAIPSSTVTLTPLPTGSRTPSATPTSTEPVQSCPTGWSCGDIGNPTLPGDETVQGSTWTLRGAGSDPSSQFHFLWQPLIGDGSVQAHLLSLSTQTAGAGAGLMIQQSSSPLSARYTVFVTAAQQLVVAFRPTWGGPVTRLIAPQATLPLYLTIGRSGTTYVAFSSKDGSRWRFLPGSQITLPGSGPLLAGVFVGSADADLLSSAAFDTVSVWND